MNIILLTIKIEHPSLYGEGCSYYCFFILISDNIEVENFNFLSTKGDIHNE